MPTSASRGTLDAINNLIIYKIDIGAILVSDKWLYMLMIYLDEKYLATEVIIGY